MSKVEASIEAEDRYVGALWCLPLPSMHFF